LVPTFSGEEVVRLLDAQYPNIKTPLGHEDAFQLLVATILSAQCTDFQVNQVTPKLFGKFPDAKSLASANLKSLESIIKSTGFYHVKAKRIKEIAKMILRYYNGKVPKTMKELINLPGVGRKTANIVLSAGFDKVEGIAVDTHVKRLSGRIGLSKEKTPEKIEADLMRITPKPLWPRLSLLLILHGRKICKARNPACEVCSLSSRCLFYKNLNSKR
jgi:endonuclease III